MTQKTRMLATMAAAVAVAAGAGAFAFFGVFEAGQAEAARKEADEKLLGFEEAQIRRLELRAKGETTVLEKRDGSWRLVQPVDAAADGDAVESLLRQLAAARRSKTVDGTDPARFGLADPAVVVRAFGAGEAKAEVALGATNTFDGSLFVRDAAGRIATTAATLRGALEKVAFDLREKRLARFGTEAVDEIRAEGERDFVLARSDEGWRLLAPVQEAADRETTEGILRALQDLRATAFAAEKPEALGPWGLETPALTVRLQRGSEPPVVVAFGRVEGKVYARAGAGPVAEVAASILDRVGKTVEELRDKRVLAFETERVRRVRLEGEGGAAEVERRGEDWFLVAPKEAKARGWKMSSIVSSLWGLRAEAFVPGSEAAERGLEKPRRQVTLLDEQGKELASLHVGREEGAFLWVRASGQERIAKVKGPRLSSLPASSAELEEAAPETAKAQ
ncbi:DUF4340 domain-containing protein [Vulgatibacter sp.]|uniref:DUF4340 domain-containing protein n=1 Tax=Vulgatibacter sp. TaxID=1971226 RepID=UPI00356A9E3F